MNIFLKTIENWYKDNKDDFSPYKSAYCLIELFQQLKNKGFTRDDLPYIGETLVNLLKLNLQNDNFNMLFDIMLAEQIKLAFNIVNKKIEEIEDEPINIEQVRHIEDNDIYPNNTNEPDIDLRGVDLGPIHIDKEFLKELGLDDE